MFTPGFQPTSAMPDTIPSSLTLTKLQRPRAGHGLVARPQLVERLKASQNLTLVLAPAGYGKTTLLSTWLETSDIPNAWLSLDEHDDDVVVFTTYLAESLHTLLPAVADGLLNAVSGVTALPPAVLARNLLNDLVVASSQSCSSGHSSSP
jgi:LuxR family maltose regulon positive regulatory protein